ncbi:MAG: hypothetical protein QOH58_3445 [Thermoleophilaceae bacterium]|jgi:DNA-binding GntR family transcriptional regulator|nr:hypothetical protein [Thermoleophilaceae bacterium]
MLSPTTSPQLSTPVPQDASLAERAYLELRDRIVSLRIPPGALVREEEVMDELAVSRTPIREALLRLAQEKLVVVVPRRGTFVTDVHVGDVGIVFELRRALEVVAAGWAAERRRDDDVPALEQMIGELTEMAAAPPGIFDPRSQIALDQRAHSLIYRLCGNTLMEDTLSSYYLLAARIWFLASDRVTMTGELSSDSLIALVAAVRDGDPEAARTHALRHSEEAEASLRAAL